MNRISEHTKDAATVRQPSRWPHLSVQTAAEQQHRGAEGGQRDDEHQRQRHRAGRAGIDDGNVVPFLGEHAHGR